MKQPTVQAKLATMSSQFRQVVAWIDQIPLHKWTQAFDDGKRYGHMTTNLAECMNSVLRGAQSLPISAIVKTTFQKINSWFVEIGMRTDFMLRAGYTMRISQTYFKTINRHRPSIMSNDIIGKILSLMFRRYQLPNFVEDQCHTQSN